MPVQKEAPVHSCFVSCFCVPISKNYFKENSNGDMEQVVFTSNLVMVTHPGLYLDWLCGQIMVACRPKELIQC